MDNNKTFNIVSLIEENSDATLDDDCHQSKLVNKIRDKFSVQERKLYISSLYCYLNYGNDDFVVKLNDIWKWVGFKRIEESKRLLVRHFKKDVDYKVESLVKKGRGRKSELIVMTIKTFKKFCLKARTDKADEIHDYYIKLEELLHETINEESNELRLKLKTNIKELENTKHQNELDRQALREKTLIDQNPNNTLCIYYGLIDNVSLTGEKLVKFGRSNNVGRRVSEHKKAFSNFRLTQVFKVTNHIEIENIIKNHPFLKKKKRSSIINGDNYTELLAINDSDFGLDKLNEMLLKIMDENEYNLKNFKAMIEKLSNLELENYKLTLAVKDLESENKKIKNNLEKFKPNEMDRKSQKTTAMTNNFYSLYAFQCSELKYKCGFVRTSQLSEIEERLINEFEGGCMKLDSKVSYPFMNKIMEFMLKNKLMCVGHGVYDGSLGDIKLIMDITTKLEKLVKGDLCSFKAILTDDKPVSSTDPEIPKKRKAKRAIDQIDTSTGRVIATFKSIEAAGRGLGLTTGTAIGVALRNNTLCKGYKFRYTGVSKEDQYTDQPVIKFCCKSGVTTKFNTISEAAKDCGISPPGLRNRILTDVHIDGYHWVFDKESTHYN